MSQKKRYGNPSKEQAYEEGRKEGASSGAERKGGRSKGELSVGFIFFAWALFFVMWAASNLIIAALVFGIVLTAAIGLLNLRERS
jgi:hypothetical protein